MAKKIVNVVYKVDSKELEATKRALASSSQEAKKFDDSLKKVDKTAKDAGKNASQSFMDFKNILGTITFVGILSGLTSLGKKIFDLGVQQEQLNIAFTTFLGSAEKAKKLMAELTKFSIITPFTPDQVNRAAKTLLAFGTAAKDIIPTLKMIGDVSAGTGKDLAEMAVIFGQIQSTGRLMGQDLLQLINAGFNPLQIISEKTGKSVKVLKEEMEKGLISFDMVKQAFIDATSEGGLFFNLMEKQSQSVGGKLSTVAGNIDEIGKAMFAASSGPISDFTDALVELSDVLLLLSTGDRLSFLEKLGLIGSSPNLKAAADVLRGIQKGADDKKESAIDNTVKAALASGNVEAYIKALGSNIYKDEIISRIRDIQKEAIDDARKKKGDGIRPKAVTKVEDESLVPITEKSKSGIDVLLDNAEKGMGDLSKMLEEYSGNIFNAFEDSIKSEQEIRAQANKEELEAWDEKEKRKREISQQTFDMGVDLLGTLLIASMQTNRDEIASIDEKYAREIELAGNNEQAKKTLEKRREMERKEAMKRQAQDERDQRVKVILAEALVNSVKALGLPPIPGANFLAAAQALAFGAVQAVAVGKYKDGEIGIKGPGTTTSDSIPAWLSRGESVINAAATAQSPNLLEAINNREISDSILRQVATGGGRQVNVLDDTRIVKAIRENQVDYISHGYTLMKVQKSGENFKRYIRSKVQGY